MWLIDIKTGEFVEFLDSKITPPYAILSHTWDTDGEQTYQEVVKIQEKYGLHVRYKLSLLVASHPAPSAMAEPYSLL